MKEELKITDGGLPSLALVSDDFIMASSGRTIEEAKQGLEYLYRLKHGKV